MAQIFAFGFVEDDLEVKKSQSGSSYVCFSLKEQAGKNRVQSYQVWAWNENVSRLTGLGVKKGSLIWITGALQLVDCTTGQGKGKTKLLKVYLSNWGYVPFRRSAQNAAAESKESGYFPEDHILPAEVLDGERDALPE